MKILHVIDSGGLYGAEIMLLNLMAEQMDMGLTPMLASIGEKKTGEKAIEKAAAKIGVKVEAFRMRPGPNYYGAAMILRFAHAEKCHLLHSHGYKGNILFGLLPRSLRKLPMVASLHGYTTMGDIAKNGFSKMRLYELLDAVSLRFIDKVVLVNSAMKEHPRLKKLPIRFAVVNNGIRHDNNEGGRTPEKKPDMDIVHFCSTGFVIGAVGRLSKEKGFDILLTAFEKAIRINTHLKLLIIGEGKERPELENMITKNNLSDKVMLAGYRQSAKDNFPALDVLVLSSLTEGLPIVALEGMQAGLPVIATKVGGLPEVLEYGKAGILVEKGNAESLCQAILRLAEGPILRKTIADRGKKRVREQYNSVRMAHDYFEIYTNLVRSN